MATRRIDLLPVVDEWISIRMTERPSLTRDGVVNEILATAALAEIGGQRVNDSLPPDLAGLLKKLIRKYSA